MSALTPTGPGHKPKRIIAVTGLKIQGADRRTLSFADDRESSGVPVLYLVRCLSQGGRLDIGLQVRLDLKALTNAQYPYRP